LEEEIILKRIEREKLAVDARIYFISKLQEKTVDLSIMGL
jgi:hypothetical protein